jgi:DNA-damage-inducible protein D
MDNQLDIFDNKPIRRVEHNGEMYFSIVDIIEILSDSPKPTAYWNKVQKGLTAESQLYPFWIKLKLLGLDGKSRPSDCANTEGVFRIIMSVPSPKAEPLKLWLAQTGKQALDETENPELGFERMTELYKAKGRTDEWIKNRLQSIETRKLLTDEWKQRGVKEGQEYSILTATIAKGTFGITPSEHSKVKGLERQNLREHMTPMELILTAFSEEATRQVTIRDDAQGFNENYDAAQLGGRIGGDALRNFEGKTGLKVVSSDNFLGLRGGETASELPEAGKDEVC